MPKPAQSSVGALETAVAYEIPTVVRRVTNTDAEVAENRQALQISVEHRGVLTAKDEAHSLGRLGECKIAGRSHFDKHVWMGNQLAFYACNVLDAFFEAIRPVPDRVYGPVQCRDP